MRIPVAAASLLASVIMSACAAETFPTPTHSAPSSTPASAATTAPSSQLTVAANPTSQSGRVVRILYRRDGGIAGFSDELVLESDGTAVYTDRRRSVTTRGRVSTQEFDRLAALVLQAKPASSAPPTVYPDMLSETLSYADSDGTLRAVDAAGIVPEFDRVLVELSKS